MPLVHPILVGRDGAAYVSVATRVQGCVFNDLSGPASRARNELFMVRIDPTGSSQTMSIRHWTAFYCTNCGNPGQVTYYAGAPVPDGQGNVLSTGLVETWNPATGFSTSDTVTYRYGPSGTGETSFDAYTTAAGRDGVYELSGGQLVARAPLNGATRWSVPTSDYEQVLQVLSDGGVTLYDPSTGQMSTIDGSGARQAAEQLPLSGPAFRTDVGELVGSTFSPDWTTYLGVGKVVTSDTTDYTVFASQTGNNADVLPGRFGLFVKGHTAKRLSALDIDIGPFRHASVRIVPTVLDGTLPDGLSLLPTFIQDVLQPDQNGNLMFTIGAAPKGVSGDTSAGCGGTLFANFNRPSDRSFHADDLKRLAHPSFSENDAMVSFYTRAKYFIDNHNDVVGQQVEYECLPDPADDHPTDPDGRDGYNSNSFVSGLLDVVTIPLPNIGGIFAWRYPGWNRPVPAIKFGVGF
ncbi:MAG: hypothetical protein R2708_03170 [Vicinamibacterales bacterium]